MEQNYHTNIWKFYDGMKKSLIPMLGSTEEKDNMGLHSLELVKKIKCIRWNRFHQGPSHYIKPCFKHPIANSS